MKLDVGMLTHDLGSIAAYSRKVEALGFDALFFQRLHLQRQPFDLRFGRRFGIVLGLFQLLEFKSGLLFEEFGFA